MKRMCFIFILIIGSYTVLTAAEHRDKQVVLSYKECINQQYLSFRLKDSITIKDSLSWFKENNGKIKYELYFDEPVDIVSVVATVTNEITKAKVSITLFYKIIDSECIVSNDSAYLIFYYEYDGRSKEFYALDAGETLARFITEEDFEINLEN